MKKTRKILSAFAVSLVAVFALSCCFFAACGNKDEEETAPTHTHTYSEYSSDKTGHWQVCDDCGEKTAISDHEFEIVSTTTEPTCTNEGKGTHICSVCGYTEEDAVIEALGHDYVLDEENSTAATCTEGGENVYVCSRGDDTQTETVAALGHDCTVTWTWAEDYTSATASRSACSRGDLSAEIATTNGDEIKSETLSDGDVTYTATVTFSDETTATDTQTVKAAAEEPGKYEALPITIDFCDSTTYSWIIGTATVEDDGIEYIKVANSTTFDGGIITFTSASSGNVTIGKEGNDALYTADTGSFSIDLSGYAGQAVSVEVKMSANGSNDRKLTLSTTTTSSGEITAVTSGGNEDYQTLDYTGIVSETASTWYLFWSKNVRIFSINVSLAKDYTPDRVQAMTIGDACFGETWTLGNFEIIDTVENDDGSVTYKITASAGQMTVNQVEAFGGTEYAAEGDLFVSFKIYVGAGETITCTTSNKTDSETFTEAGYYTFVERITVSEELYGETSVGLAETAIVIKITDESGMTNTMNIWFGHIDLPANYWTEDGGETSGAVGSGLVTIDNLVSAGMLTVGKLSGDTIIYQGSDGTTITIMSHDVDSGKDAEIANKSSGYSTEDGNVTFYNYVKTSGGARTNQSSIKISVVGACKVTVYAISSGDSARNVVLYDSNCSNIVGTFVDSVGKTNVAVGTVGVTAAGEYYIGMNTSGGYFFAIEITY